jgi:hypothetical protein
MNILFSHPNFIGIVEKINETCPFVVACSDYKEVLDLVEKKEIERLCILLDHTEINTLDLIKKVYAIDKTLPILALDCNFSFEQIADYPELLEDNIFCINSSELIDEAVPEVFNDFFERTLTSKEIEILTKKE